MSASFVQGTTAGTLHLLFNNNFNNNFILKYTYFRRKERKDIYFLLFHSILFFQVSLNNLAHFIISTKDEFGDDENKKISSARIRENLFLQTYVCVFFIRVPPVFR